MDDLRVCKVSRFPITQQQRKGDLSDMAEEGIRMDHNHNNESFHAMIHGEISNPVLYLALTVIQ